MLTSSLLLFGKKDMRYMFQRQCKGTAISQMSADVYYFSKTLMISVRFSCHVSRVCVAIFVRVSVDVVIVLM